MQLLDEWLSKASLGLKQNPAYYPPTFLSSFDLLEAIPYYDFFNGFTGLILAILKILPLFYYLTGSPPFAFVVTGPPAGLTLTGSVLSGIPVTTGVYNMTITVTNTCGSPLTFQAQLVVLP